MADWDPFRTEEPEMPYEERKAAWEEAHAEEPIGGKSDGGAGGVRLPTPADMNALIRDTFEVRKQER